jgi:hypothetical protein
MNPLPAAALTLVKSIDADESSGLLSPQTIRLSDELRRLILALQKADATPKVEP